MRLPAVLTKHHLEFWSILGEVFSAITISRNSTRSSLSYHSMCQLSFSLHLKASRSVHVALGHELGQQPFIPKRLPHRLYRLHYSVRPYLSGDDLEPQDSGVWRV
jgi:hypothetical protein